MNSLRPREPRSPKWWRQKAKGTIGSDGEPAASPLGFQTQVFYLLGTLPHMMPAGSRCLQHPEGPHRWLVQDAPQLGRPVHP